MTALLSIPEAAARLGCSQNHVYRLITAGLLPVTDIAQPGSRKPKSRIREDTLAAFIRTRTRRARTPQGTAA